ncbi:MAG: PorT family protein [Bacteroides sp.]|nr:PorT family protein [Bacteroides sp.]MCM1447296.1 PorT family protein [Bacteroides sp.]
MKYRIIQLLFLLTLPLMATAQVGKYRSDLAIGVNGGIIMNKITFSPRVQQGMPIGPEIGLSLRYTCEKYFATVCALQAEINYSRQGWNEMAENGTYNYARTLDYVHIPFMARMGFGRERKGFMGYVILGPEIGFCIGEGDSRTGEWTDEGLPMFPEGPTAQYNKAVEKKFEYGILGGAGLEFSHPHVGHFAIEGRYIFGLSDIFNNGKKDPFGRSAHSSIVVKMSYFWDIKKTKGKTIR